MAAPPPVNCAGTFANLSPPNHEQNSSPTPSGCRGATGMVGRTILKVLRSVASQWAPIPVASARSVGKKVEFAGSTSRWSTGHGPAHKPHVALFSAGGTLSLEWAPKFAAAGITVVDNSAWRMSDDHKLVVPEVNGEVVKSEDLILANPNCTTMQSVMCLKPIHDKWGIERGVVSSIKASQEPARRPWTS